MKRILALLLCLVCLAGCFAACKKEEPAVVDPVTNPEYTGAATVTRSGETVTIQLPLSLLDEKYRKNPSLFCDDNGYNNAEIRNNTVTVTMLKTKYDLQLVEKGLDAIGVIYDLLEDGGFSYFKKIEFLDQKAFQSVTILVDGAAFRADKTTAASLTEALAQSCFLYQVYTTANSYHCRVTAKDAESGDTVFDKTYRSNNRKLG